MLANLPNGKIAKIVPRRSDQGWQPGWSINHEKRVTIADIFRSPLELSRPAARVSAIASFLAPQTLQTSLSATSGTGQPLRQSERQWLDIEVTGWPAGRAFDLKEFSIPGEIAESHRAIWWWRSPAALGLIPLPLQLDELRQPDDQAGEFLRLVIDQPLVREGDGIWRLSVHMGQRQAIGIDDTIAARDRQIAMVEGTCAAASGEHKLRRRRRSIRRMWPQEPLGRPWKGRAGLFRQLFARTGP